MEVANLSNTRIKYLFIEKKYLFMRIYILFLNFLRIFFFFFVNYDVHMFFFCLDVICLLS